MAIIEHSANMSNSGASSRRKRAVRASSTAMDMGVKTSADYLFDAASSRWTPGRLAQQVSVLRESTLSRRDIAGEVIARFGASTAPLDGALLAIAEAADSSGTGNAFHNPAHARD